MIVIPMAGLSSRFFKAGYSKPKYMLDLNGQTVFAHALLSFKAQFGTEPFVLICRAEYDTPTFIRAQWAALGLSEDQLALVVLDQPTAGQAETVALGLDRAKAAENAPLTIFNIDTFRPGFAHTDRFKLSQIAGYIEVFEGEGTHWSFVRPDTVDPASQRAVEVAEKQRISDLCSTGLYHFHDVALFRRLYAPIAQKNPAKLQGGERYIAPLYNDALKLGHDIRYTLIRPDEVQFCGTPDEYLALGGHPPS